MNKKQGKEEVKIIIQYQNKKDTKTLQKVIENLFNSYIIRTVQNIKKGR